MDIRGEAIRAELSRFLSRKTPPRGLGDETLGEEVVSLVNAISSALPRNPSDAAEVLRAGLHRYECGAKHRGWPTAGEIRDACAPRQNGEAVNVMAQQVESCAAWWRRNGTIPNWWNRHEIAREMVNRGDARPHDLWRAGMDVPRDLRDWPAARRWDDAPAARRFGEPAE